MQYPVQTEGFQAQQLTLETAGLFSAAKLLLNGQPAPKGAKRGEYMVKRDDGTEVTAKLKPIFFDPVPQIIINNSQTITVVEPLHWYQWAWAGLPIALIFVGGLLGGLSGFIATSLSIQVFRSKVNPVLQYLVVGGISVLAVVAYLVVAMLIAGLIN